MIKKGSSCGLPFRVFKSIVLAIERPVPHPPVSELLSVSVL